MSRFLGPGSEVSPEAEQSSSGPAVACADQLHDGPAGRLQLDKVTSTAPNPNQGPHEGSYSNHGEGPSLLLVESAY